MFKEEISEKDKLFIMLFTTIAILVIITLLAFGSYFFIQFIRSLF